MPVGVAEVGREEVSSLTSCNRSRRLREYDTTGLKGLEGGANIRDFEGQLRVPRVDRRLVSRIAIVVLPASKKANSPSTTPVCFMPKVSR